MSLPLSQTGTRGTYNGQYVHSVCVAVSVYFLPMTAYTPYQLGIDESAFPISSNALLNP